jgi:hypothetical protein
VTLKESLLLSFVGGVGWFLVSRLIWESIEAQLRARRLSKVLALHALAALRVLNGSKGVDSNKPPSDGLVAKLGRAKVQLGDLRAGVRSGMAEILSGYIFPPALASIQPFSEALPIREAILALRYHDRWSRLLEVERRYAVLYKELFSVACGLAGAPADRALIYKRDEYVEELTSWINLMSKRGTELRGIAAEVLRSHAKRVAIDKPSRRLRGRLRYVLAMFDADPSAPIPSPEGDDSVIARG